MLSLVSIGYKKTALYAIVVGLIGLALQWLSGLVGTETGVFSIGDDVVTLNFIIYLLGECREAGQAKLNKNPATCKKTCVGGIVRLLMRPCLLFCGNWSGMLGNMMNFLAYLFMGIPAGNLLVSIGYKKGCPCCRRRQEG